MIVDKDKFGRFLIIDTILFSIIFTITYSTISYSIGLALDLDILSRESFLPRLDAEGLWILLGAVTLPTYLTSIIIRSNKIDKLMLVFRKPTTTSNKQKFGILPGFISILFILFGFLLMTKPACERSYCVTTFVHAASEYQLSFQEALYVFNPFTRILSNSLALSCFFIGFRALIAQTAIAHAAITRSS